MNTVPDAFHKQAASRNILLSANTTQTFMRYLPCTHGIIAV